MREFSIVYTKIWHDSKFRALENPQKQLFLYLLCCPHGNQLGCFTLPIEYISYDIGLPAQQIKLLLDSLIAKNLINFDYKNNLVFIKNYLKHNKISGSNSEKGILNLYSTLQSDSFLVKEVGEMINIYLNLNVDIPEIEPEKAPKATNFELNIPLDSPLEPPLKGVIYENKPLTSPLQAPYNPLSQEIERDREIEIERDTNTILSDSAKPRLTSGGNGSEEVVKIFEHWKTQTGHLKTALDDKRRKVIKNAIKMGYTPEQLMDAVSGCCKTPHNMGKNERGEKYDGIGLIFRSADQIDRFIRNNTAYVRGGNSALDKKLRDISELGFKSAKDYLEDDE